MRDFMSVIVADCCAGRTVAMHEATLENVRMHFGVVAKADDIEQVWREMAGRPRLAASAG